FEIGVTKGTTSDTYSPNADVERDQMASFVLRMYQHIDNLEEAPQPPTNVEVEVSGTAGNQLAVSWTAPENDGGTPITGYTIQWKTGDQEYTDDQQATVDDSTTWTSPATLTKATTYTFRVNATNNAGTSQWSDEASQSPGTTPGAVRDLVVTPGVDETTLDLTWKAPTDDGGTPITGYQVQWATGRQTPDSEDIDDPAATEYKITGLTVGLAYRVHIQAVNGAGEGAITAPADETQSAVRPATTVGAGSVRVSLPLATATDGSFARGKLFASVTWRTPTLITGQSFVAGVVTGEMAFDIQRKCGKEPWPATHALALAASPVRGSSQTFTASAVTQSLMSAELRGGTGSSGTLNNGEECTFRVRANTYIEATGGNTGTQDPASEPTLNGAWITGSATPLGVPGVPGNPKVTPANKSLVVTWDTPMMTGTSPEVDNGGTPITGYKISWESPLNSPVGDMTVPATANSYTIPDLGNEFDYYVRVAAVNARGESASVPSSPQATSPGPVPGAPTGVTVAQPPAPARSAPADLRGTALVVSWTAPAAQTGIASVTGYDVQRRTSATPDTTPPAGPGTPVTVPHSGTGTTLTDGETTATALTAGTSYDYRVRAKNGTGNGDVGPWSAWVSGAAEGLPDPVDVNNIEVIGANRSLVVTWTPPASNGSDITRYVVQYGPNRTAADLTRPLTTFSTSVAATALPTVTITGLENGVPYIVGITPVNGVGSARQVLTAGSDTPMVATAAPATVTAVADPTRANTGATLINVTWSAVPNVVAYKVEYLDVANSPDSTWQPVSATGTSASTVALASGSTGTYFNAAATRSATITVNAGTATARPTYVVRVLPVTQALVGGNPSGNGIEGTPGFSAPVKAEATPATPVTGLTAAQLPKTTTVRVTWTVNTATTPAEIAEAAGITGYLVNWYPLSTQVPGNRGRMTVAADARSFDITGLTAIDQDFAVTVSPVNAIGTGVLTLVPAATAPPANVPADTINGSIRLAPATT
ncbi:MAG: fibronectin type III domain-containing protein, partial [Acidimicrobiaceae bacterium]|nr:fibronectin type III domain-containing protein [Acidimicrobiaceae bacterium]